MYYHRKARVVYLANPRTASQATAAALLTVGFKKAVPGDHHSRLFEVGPVTPANRDDWWVFTTCRNHFDAAVSWVFAKHQGEPPEWNVDAFRNAFDGNPWVGLDTLWHRHPFTSTVIDEFFRFESLEADLARMLPPRGIAVPELPRINASPGRNGAPYQRFYSPETRAYVAERFETEIAAFGYRFLALGDAPDVRPV